MAKEHLDCAELATCITISKLHKETKKQFSEAMNDLYNVMNEHTGQRSPMLSEYHHRIIMENADVLDSAIVHERDFEYNCFECETLTSSYLLKINNKVAERPQYMLMRVSVGIHGEDVAKAIESYNLLSEKFFTHASPTLLSAATPKAQLCSSFLLATKGDSIDGIYDTIKQTALISKAAGGIGLHVHSIRAKGTYVTGTNGVSKGLVPMLRVYNNSACYVGRGGNGRGAFVVYLEPWHADVFELIDLKKNAGKDEVRARDLFYALWIPDLFMERVENDELWSLMCPHNCPGLQDCWGSDFEALYTRYEREKRYVKQIRAQTLWMAVVESQMETGAPSMLYKDACNRKSNQKNLGTIKCGNLSAEIVEYTSPDETAVCNLASIALNMFVKDGAYDFGKLKEVTKIVTRNLDKIIDVNYYPVPEAKNSNMKHRPIGIGVQGLADTFVLLRLPYESEEAQLLNQKIFETIYYAALEASSELAERYGPYESYAGCPASKGILQYDMWNKTPTDLWDWAALKSKIARTGLRNSLLLALMPTICTSQILGNSESFEPFASNVYTRRVSEESQVVNRNLQRDLTAAGLWDDNMKNLIVHNNGSVQNIESIPKDIRDLYKTVWEISVKTTIKMAADRGAFIDQSQSFDIHVAEPSYGKLTSIHFHTWKMGLKTGMYHLRTKPDTKAIQLTIDKYKET